MGASGIPCSPPRNCCFFCLGISVPTFFWPGTRLPLVQTFFAARVARLWSAPPAQGRFPFFLCFPGQLPVLACCNRWRPRPWGLAPPSPPLSFPGLGSTFFPKTGVVTLSLFFPSYGSPHFWGVSFFFFFFFCLPPYLPGCFLFFVFVIQLHPTLKCPSPLQPMVYFPLFHPPSGSSVAFSCFTSAPCFPPYGCLSFPLFALLSRPPTLTLCVSQLFLTVSTPVHSIGSKQVRRFPPPFASFFCSFPLSPLESP